MPKKVKVVVEDDIGPIRHKVVEGTNPVKIKKAFKELSIQAFGVWIYLHEIDLDRLVGRKEIAKHLGYSLSNANLILRELCLTEYVETERTESGKTGLVLLNRAITVRESAFIRA
jgi:DNA-binding MarR family transcriptional regulator